MTVFLGRDKVTVTQVVGTVVVASNDITSIGFSVEPNSDYKPKVGDVLMITVSRHLGQPQVLAYPNAKDQA